MKHARPDYDRFQDPSNDPLITKVMLGLAFARNLIKDAGAWNSQCERMIAAPLAELGERNKLVIGSTPIGADEPVMLFRAQDQCFEDVLNNYTTMLEENPDVQQELIDSVYAQIDRARAWQRCHSTKVPDLPATESTP